MFVSDILNRKGSSVVSVGPGDRIGDVASVLHDERIGAVLVRDETGTLVGMLSERDIVNAIADQGSSCLDFKASDLMTAEVVTCKPNDSVTEAMTLMTERRIRHLPVIESNKLLGVISIGDVVKERLAEAELEAEQLREYITAS